MTDWNLIIQGNISLLWIQECLKSENRGKQVGDLINEFKLRNENCEILNPGTLFMATYLLFLYPKESELAALDLKNIDTSQFDIKALGTKKKNETNKAYLLRRIRNSIAHANFSIKSDFTIEFEDNNKQGTNYFKVEIGLSEFGNIVNNYIFEAKRQKFK